MPDRLLINISQKIIAIRNRLEKGCYQHFLKRLYAHNGECKKVFDYFLQKVKKRKMGVTSHRMTTTHPMECIVH